ncbi:putative protease [Peptoclostridium litorale DSM 5388]|uniref:Peptidase U32 family protein n=1 Tax=Peptoclostridium litorale DSM 5388 TaxID=1121324 RepID=A0A069RG52_PEPLI|nr:U32 family peptidase [Peptoclostridium litorale]KDR95996.1 peptidase U32 family protein [Peptoclostridium litorale DSM 5388]SIO07003.1 putative protease [Peptoclostridium litorale DSM 5388]
MKKIEILSPAGSFEAFVAAVQSGADAIYIGGQQFSARAFADNFDRDEIMEAVRYAHIRGVKVYVTVNTLVKEKEAKGFMEYVDFLYGEDVDALILQDIGMAAEVKKRYPDFEIHASTQMSAHSLEDVKFLENMGFSRVVLSRELSIDEISHISKNAKAEIEIFVHGALCICYSGQCLMSSMIGGRSGNRGKCAQPCRKEYDILNTKSGETIRTDGRYVLSPMDTCTIDEIGKIIDSGAISLKIEGRMKKPEYVATVTGIYKKAAQSYIESGKSTVSQDDIDELNSIFSRGFTKGYMFDETNGGIISTNNQSKKGIRIGTVEYLDKGRKRLGIKLEKRISKGDGLTVGGIVGRVLIKGMPSNYADAGQTVELDYIGTATEGEVIYRNLDAELTKKAQQTYKNGAENRPALINMEFSVSIGKYPKLSMRDNRANEVCVEGETPAEKALKVAMSSEKIMQQLQKLGGTPYEIESAKVDVQEGLSMPVKLINEMRRDAIERLDEMRAIMNEGRNYIEEDLSMFELNSQIGKELPENPQIRVKAYGIEQLKKVMELEDADLIDAMYFECERDIQEAANICREKGVRLICSLPRVMRNEEYSLIDRLNGAGVSDFCVSTHGQIGAVKGIEASFCCDHGLNVFNSYSAGSLTLQGSGSVCISPELNISDIKNACDKESGTVEAFVYGRLPLMISEYCLVGTLAGECTGGKADGKCVNEGSYAIRDKMDEVFPVGKANGCRSIIYNSKTLCMLDRLRDVYKAGVGIFKIDLALESPDDSKEIVKAHIQAVEDGFEMDEYTSGVYQKLKDRGITNGHFYRGVE